MALQETDGNQSGVEITALADGTGFTALWFDEDADKLMAQNYDWFGQSTTPTSILADVGGLIVNGSPSLQISATLLDDGRMMVSYVTGGIDGDSSSFGLGMTIIDPREGQVLGSGSSETLFGGVGDDIIYGNGGDDVVFGLQGNDFIYDDQNSASGNAEFYGGAGDDLLSGGAAADVLDGGRGDDRLYGGTGADELYGGNDDDEIYGGDGDDLFLRGNNGSDIIDGGAGRDFLGGGPAADTFVFSDITHSTTDGFRDRILDFQQGLDLIDVSGIDAIAGGGDDAFTWIGSDAFSNTAGELRFGQTGSKTIVFADVDGDGVADFTFELSNLVILQDVNFIL